MTRRVAAAALAVAAVALAGCGGGSTTPKASPHPSSGSPAPTYTAPPATLPVTNVPLSTDPPPWLAPAVVANGADSLAYVTAAGLPYAEEMLQVHYHAHLDVIVDGKPVTVPPYLGFVVQGNKVVGLAPLHTHDDTGIIHIENSVPADFLLGQVFIEWGVTFTKTCLGPYCAGQGKELAVFLDGTRYDGDPTHLVLAKHQEIAVEYGDKGQLPQPPASFAFPNGL